MTAASNEVVAGELRALIAKATDEDLADGGRYWADSLTDLTQCPHGDMGRYDHPADGELIEWLWNRRVEIAGLYEARAHSDPRPVAEGLREGVARAIASKTYAYCTVTDEGSDQYDCGEWEEFGCDAQATYLQAADQVLSALATHSPAPMAGEVVDLERNFFASLIAAAEQSKWMPPEYMMNDWVSDCRNFLINGPAAAHPSTQEG
jgi:hypothetical protein